VGPPFRLAPPFTAACYSQPKTATPLCFTDRLTDSCQDFAAIPALNVGLRQKLTFPH